MASGEFQGRHQTASYPGAGIPRLVKNWVTLSSVCNFPRLFAPAAIPIEANKQQEGSLQRVPAKQSWPAGGYRFRSSLALLFLFTIARASRPGGSQ